MTTLTIQSEAEDLHTLGWNTAALHAGMCIPYSPAAGGPQGPGSPELPLLRYASSYIVLGEYSLHPALTGPWGSSSPAGKVAGPGRAAGSDVWHRAQHRGNRKTGTQRELGSCPPSSCQWRTVGSGHPDGCRACPLQPGQGPAPDVGSAAAPGPHRSSVSSCSSHSTCSPPGRALGSRPVCLGLRMCRYIQSPLWSGDRGRIQSGRPDLCHSCGNRVPTVPRSRSLAAAGTAAAHSAGSGCLGPGKIGSHAEGLTPCRIECGPGFPRHKRQSRRTRRTTMSSLRALHSQCLCRSLPLGCRSTAGILPAARYPPEHEGGLHVGTGVGRGPQGKAGSVTAPSDTPGPTSLMWRT